MGRKIGMVALGGLMTVALSGCAATWDVDGVAAQAPRGDAFTQALHQEYVGAARFERGEEDWADVAVFVERARLAAEGQAVAPMAPAERGLAAADLGAAYERLTAALATPAPQVAPVACAKAQVGYEHWIEQREEGHQPDHIAAAKAAYDAAIPDCVAKVAAPAPAPAPAAAESFVVHFPFDSASIVDEAAAVIDRVVSFFSGHKAKSVSVVAHTDTAGADGYNDALSQRRAAAVKDALVQGGVPAQAISTAAKGEAAPAVPTGDNVAEQANRRATITVQP